MKGKKLLVAASLLTASVGLISFQNAAPDEEGGGAGIDNGTSRDWEQNPPYVDSVWVKQLDAPLTDGSTI